MLNVLAFQCNIEHEFIMAKVKLVLISYWVQSMQEKAFVCTIAPIISDFLTVETRV